MSSTFSIVTLGILLHHLRATITAIRFLGWNLQAQLVGS